MADVIYLLIAVAFFAAAAGYVHLCARITGIDNVEGTSGAITGHNPGSTAEVRS